MRTVLVNTGTELLLGDVQDAHLAFIAREIFSLGLRIEEQRTVPDTKAIRRTLGELLSSCEILFVTGGLGPTDDDITREMVADLLGLQLRQDPQLLALLQQRLQTRGIKWTTTIARQTDVPAGAQVLPNKNGSAPGLYLKANINSRVTSPHLFVLPRVTGRGSNRRKSPRDSGSRAWLLRAPRRSRCAHYRKRRRD